MRRGVLAPLLAALLAALLVASATPVAAHGNHVEADSQRSADGTVVVEAVRPLTDGFLVLHRATADGGIGDPIGNTPVALDDGFQREVDVEMDDDAWADWPANATLWVVFHADADDDGEFDPGTDPATSAFGSVTGQTITLAKADRPAHVLAERSQPQQTASATATVGRAALPEDGFLVLRTGEGTDGRVVGTQALDTGVHENVDVAFDPSAFPENRSTVGLYAQLYADDGDREFTDADRLVRAGGDPVSSYFLVWAVENESVTTSEPVVRTPTDDPDVVTPTETTGGGESTTNGEVGATTSTATASSDAGVPGYGVVHAAVAVLVAAVLVARR